MSDISFSANKSIPSFEKLHCNTVLIKFRNKTKTNDMCGPNYMHLSYDVVSGIDITPSFIIDNPLVVYRFW